MNDYIIVRDANDDSLIMVRLDLIDQAVEVGDGTSVMYLSGSRPQRIHIKEPVDLIYETIRLVKDRERSGL